MYLITYIPTYHVTSILYLLLPTKSNANHLSKTMHKFPVQLHFIKQPHIQNKTIAMQTLAMFRLTIPLYILLCIINLIECSGDGNIHLLEDEIAAAMKSCVLPAKINQKQKRSTDYNYRYKNRNVDNTEMTSNLYDHERRNTSDLGDEISVLNGTDYDYEGYGSGDAGEKLLESIPRQAGSGTNTTRTKRGDPLVPKPDGDQCLSQCIFANLQVVDARGIPREAELWNKIQSSVNSQQSRGALRDQLGACFQELQSEAEDDGCSYSNKLERCLMLRVSDRRIGTTEDHKANSN